MNDNSSERITIREKRPSFNFIPQKLNKIGHI